MRNECDVLTMYFVDEALQKLKPILEEHLVETECRVVTVGYEMKGWSACWVETIVGLNVFVYDLKEMQKLEEDPHIKIQEGDTRVPKEEEEELAPIVDRGPPLEYRDEDPDEYDDNFCDFDETIPFDQENDTSPR